MIAIEMTEEEKLPLNVGEFWYIRRKDASVLAVAKVVSIDQRVICIQKSEHTSITSFVEYGADVEFVQKRKGGFE